jgi:hypothetical protein
VRVSARRPARSRMRSAPVIAFSPADRLISSRVLSRPVVVGTDGSGQPGSAACRSPDSAHLRASAQSFRCFIGRPRRPRKGAASPPVICQSSHSRRCSFAQHRSASRPQQGAGELTGLMKRDRASSTELEAGRLTGLARSRIRALSDHGSHEAAWLP